MSNDPSKTALNEATRSRANFSGHGNAKGAAGVRRASFDPDNCELLSQPGQAIAISPDKDGFQAIDIGMAWDNVIKEKSGLLGKLLGKVTKRGVDLDLGCLYEMQDGTRGCIQAFGEKFGALDKPPYMNHSGDERTGDKEGYDEEININAAHWNDIKRILVYVYIYDGAPNWAEISPKIMLDIPGEQDLVVSLSEYNDKFALCAVGGLENVRGGIKLTNYTEYFPGHDEMDRAFGFGLTWGDGTGRKAPQ